MTAKSRFTHHDVNRAIKGALAAGLAVRSVTIAPNGTITLGTIASGAAPRSTVNPWDVELDMPAARVKTT